MKRYLIIPALLLAACGGQDQGSNDKNISASLVMIICLASCVYLIASLFGVGNIPSVKLNLNATGNSSLGISSLLKSIG